MTVNDPLLGTIIDGRYRIDARIASGGMASVYRGMNVRLQRPVAVKFIHPHLAEQADFTARFIREAQAAAALSNPHIVNVYDQGVVATPQGNRAYMVMELVHGPNLRAELNRHGSLCVRDALTITQQVLDALSSAHQAGIIHRDVKPENILLSEPISTDHLLEAPNYHVKVADFGLARAVTDATSHTSGQMLGTVAYVAPEIVLRGHSEQAADIYSVGIMLYELLAGVQPFTGESPVAVAYAHVNSSMPRLLDQAEWMPASIDALISSLTAKDPAQRPSQGADALALLEDVIATIPPEIMMRRIPVFPAREHMSAPTAVNTEAPLSATSALSSPTSSAALASATTSTPAAAPSAPASSPVVSSSAMASTQHIMHTLPLRSTVGMADEQQQTSVHSKEQHGARTQRHANISSSSRAQSASAEQPHSSVHPASSAYPTASAQAATPAKLSAQTPVQSTPEVHIAPKASPRLSPASSAPASSQQRSRTPASSQPHLRKHKRKAWKKPVFFTVLILMMLSILGYGGYWWFTAGPGLRVPVPNVAGLNAEEAHQALSDAGLTYTDTHDFSDTVEKGHVISTDPEGGEAIHPSNTVNVVISDGVEYLTVPNVVGMSQDEATQTLIDARFTADVAEEYSQDVPEGAVISQDPGADTSAVHDSAVHIVVSKGREPLNVPDVGDADGAAYQQLLKDTGFEVSAKEEFSDTVPKGGVISVDPQEGSQLFRGDSVSVVISKGPEPVEVPNVFGKPKNQAQEILEEAGFKVSFNVIGGMLGLVQSQNPGAGEKAQPGSTITLTIV